MALIPPWGWRLKGILDLRKLKNQCEENRVSKLWIHAHPPLTITYHCNTSTLIVTLQCSPFLLCYTILHSCCTSVLHIYLKFWSSFTTPCPTVALLAILYLLQFWPCTWCTCMPTHCTFVLLFRLSCSPYCASVLPLYTLPFPPVTLLPPQPPLC